MRGRASFLCFSCFTILYGMNNIPGIQVYLILGGENRFAVCLKHILKSQNHTVATVESNTHRQSLQNVFSWDDLRKRGLPKNCDAVVNISQREFLPPVDENPLTEDALKKGWDVNIKTTEIIVNAIKNTAKPPEVFVNMSSCFIYPQGSEELTEDSQVADNFVSYIYREREEASTLPSNINTRTVIIRQGHVFHTGELEGKHSKLVGARQKWYPVVHFNDIIGIYKHALLNSNVNGVLNAVTPKPVRLHQLSKSFFPWHRASDGITEKHLPFPHLVEYLKDKNGCKVLPSKTLKEGYKFSVERIPSSVYFTDCADYTF